MNAYGGQALGDYITVYKAGNKVVSSFVKGSRQAWLKLTSHGAFVTITCGLEA